MEEKLEYIKFRERLDFAINVLKQKCEENKITFDKDFLIDAVGIARCLFIRSEIQYSGRKA